MKWSDSGDILEVKSGTTAIAGGVVSSIELFSYAEHQSGSRRRSTNVCERDKLFDNRPAVLPPFIACSCRTVHLYYCVYSYLSISVHLLNCHFYIFLIISLTTRHPNHSCGTSFRRLKRSMVATVLSRRRAEFRNLPL